MTKTICICCPLGCLLTVDDSDKNDIKVSGNACPRGKAYAVQETVNPKRIVTTTVNVTGGEINVVSVKTTLPIDKSKTFDLLAALKGVNLTAPIDIGDVVLKDVYGADVVVTKSVAKKQ